MSMSQEEIDALINSSASQSGESNDVLVDDANSPNTIDNELAENSTDELISNIDPKLELLYDLQLPVSIELGRTNMLIRDVLRLGRGSVIEFDKLVSEPVDVLINGKKIAEGEVVVIDKHFGIRITTLIDPADRLKTIRK